jgi:NAD(P)-dependent dehydrogenase (short-subunit alcohol dehydrogenase family)
LQADAVNDAGRIALVTGAGSGIGRVVACALAGTGYIVVLAGRRRDPLEETAALVLGNGGRSFVVPTDIRDPREVKALFEAVEIEFGRLDLLFNNAGIGAPVLPVEDIAYEDWRRVLDTNVTGPYLCTQQAFRLMKKQNPRGGRIINNGSVSSQAPRPLFGPYTISKHAITGLTKSTALDGRPFDIACGQIDLGVVATEAASWITGAPTLQANGATASEAGLDPQHVADAVLYMAGLPLEANVLFMTVMPTRMPLVGRG